MDVTIGSRIGTYEVRALLGEGGMGRVFHAFDTALHRDVAIKVLSESVAADPDRLMRFDREAKTLAALNHPHIAQIYGIVRTSSASALVMELVDGDTLSERIARGPISTDEALVIATQIADALHAAHEAGIVHRDLKPANVKVRRDGTVKVLDFGLAKTAVIDAREHSATITSPAMTMHGLILGTAAYMSPEQAKGQPVDRRTDIWAFGCVIYEMLTGKRPFGGEGVTDTIGAVLHKEPDWNALDRNIPPRVRVVLERCLQKDPRQRVHDIADVKLALAGAFDTPATISARKTDWRWPALAAVMTMAVIGLGSWMLWGRPAPDAPASVVRLAFDPGFEGQIASTRVGAATVLSPDGNTLAFIGQSGQGVPQLYVRRLDQMQALPLSLTEDAQSPFFSPDGQWMGFFAGGKLKKIAVTGGSPIVICDAAAGRGGWWAADDSIVFTPDAGIATLWRVSASGGKPEPLTQFETGEVQHKWAQVLPGGRAVLYTSHTSTNGFEDANIVAQPLPSGPRKVLRRGAYYGRYASGHLLYVSRGTLFAAPFDLDRLEVVGEPAAMVEGVMANPAITGGAQYSVADTGTLAYVTGQSAALQRPVHWLTRGGAATLLRTTPSNWSDPRFSPSGQQLATVIPNEAGMVALWIYDWTRDVLTRVSATNAVAPVWSADGQFIAYASPIPAEKRTAIFVERVDATTPAERLTRNPTPQFPHSWHPNGKLLAVTELSEAAGLDVMLLPVERSDGSGWKAAAATPFISSPANEQEPMFSPDGKWVAYTSNETGRDEIYVRSLTSAARSAVSTGGGRHPAWSRTRAEILYNSPDGSIMSTAYTVEHDTLRLQKPQVWSTLRTFQRSPSQGGFYSWSFDVHPDGERLAVALAPEGRGDGKVVLVFNLLPRRR